MIGIIPDPPHRSRRQAEHNVALPRFKEIENEIRERIVRNQLGPGAKLPSEAELMMEFAVSRITVRQALSGLHNAGLIEKVNGKGSFVTRPTDTPSLGALTGFYETARARGQLAYGKLASVKLVRAPAFVTRVLDPGARREGVERVDRALLGRCAGGVFHAAWARAADASAGAGRPGDQ